MRRLALGAMLVLVAAACDHPPTTPLETAPPPVWESLPPGQRLLSQDGAAFQCLTALATGNPADPWRYGRAEVRFPAAELAPDGRTLRYSYRGHGEAGRLVAAAECEVPATPAAVIRMHRRLKVRDAGSESPLAAVQLATLRVTACAAGYVGDYPACYPITSPTAEPGDEEDAGGGGGDIWGGGGDGEEPANPEDADLPDDQIDPDTVPNCSQPQFYAWTRAYCRAVSPEGQQREWTEAALERVKNRGGECADIAAFGMQLLAQGRIRYYEWQSGDSAGWGDPEIGVLLGSFWVDRFGDPAGLGVPTLDNKLVHEIEHAMGREHVEHDQTPNSLACDGI